MINPKSCFQLLGLMSSRAIEVAGQEHSIEYAYCVWYTVKNANTACVLLTI